MKPGRRDRRAGHSLTRVYPVSEFTWLAPLVALAALLVWRWALRGMEEDNNG